MIHQPEQMQMTHGRARLTRRQLLAQNIQLQAQLDVHNHVTRKALNMRTVALKTDLQDLTRQHDALVDKLTAAEHELERFRVAARVA